MTDETETGRKKIIALSKSAEKKYANPVKSWLTGWIYQYTRTRSGTINQSIKVMENFPDAYTRLQEFKLMLSEGEWNAGSYNYFLFLELIEALPEYEPLKKQFVHAFILQLKDLLIQKVDVFMLQHKSSEEKKRIGLRTDFWQQPKIYEEKMESYSTTLASLD